MRTGRRGHTGHHRRTIANLLDAGDDQLITGLESAQDDVLVADDVAEGDRLLARDRLISLMPCWRLNRSTQAS